MTKTKKANKPKPIKIVKQVVVKKPKKSKSRKQKRSGGSLAAMGRELGGIVGLPGVGKVLGSTIGRIMGRGDYVLGNGPIKANSLVSGNTPPQFGSSKNVTTVAHREFIKDIQTGSTLVGGLTAFSAEVFAINPGLFATFPWLNELAASFEEYEVLGMIFEFKSTSASALNSTNTALGTVVLSTDYNVLNPAFINKQQQENYEFAQSVKPAESAIHAVECARGMNPVSQLYVRDGPITTGDARLYDLGNFQISTVGMQAASVTIGELWVSYHIAFYKPKLPAGGLNSSVLSDHYYIGNGVDMTHSCGASDRTPVTGSSLQSRFTVSNMTFTFPSSVQSGIFMFTWTLNCDASTMTTYPTIASGVNLTFSNAWKNDTVSKLYQPSAGGTNSTAFSMTIIVTVTGPSATIVLGTNMTLPGLTNASVDVYITALSDQWVGDREEEVFEIVLHK